MKTIILAALLGALTIGEIDALHVVQRGPKENVAEQAAKAAELAGNKDEEKENKETIKAQGPAEAKESLVAQDQAAALQKAIEARIQAESNQKFLKEEKKKASKEEREEALQKRITEEIKARKEIVDEALE